MTKRILLIIGSVGLIIGGVWLAILSPAHAEMAAMDDCTISTLAADCEGTAEHTLHVLAQRVDQLGAGIATPGAQDLLSRLLAVLSVGSFISALALSVRWHGYLRRSLRFRQLLIQKAERHFRAWRVTLQELHPLRAH